MMIGKTPSITRARGKRGGHYMPSLRRMFETRELAHLQGHVKPILVESFTL